MVLSIANDILLKLTGIPGTFRVLKYKGWYSNPALVVFNIYLTSANNTISLLSEWSTSEILYCWYSATL